jgi:hypothetical protein
VASTPSVWWVGFVWNSDRRQAGAGSPAKDVCDPSPPPPQVPKIPHRKGIFLCDSDGIPVVRCVGTSFSPEYVGKSRAGAD